MSHRPVILGLVFLVLLGCQGGGSPSTPSAPSTAPATSQGTSPAPAQSAVSLTTPSAPVPVGQEVRLSLETHEARDLYAVDVTLRYDPTQISFVRSLEGNLLNRDGASTVVEAVPSDESPGELMVGLSRVGEVGGVSGSGVLLMLVFQATQPGPARVQIDHTTATLRDASDTPLKVEAWKDVILTIQ